MKLYNYIPKLTYVTTLLSANKINTRTYKLENTCRHTVLNIKKTLQSLRNVSFQVECGEVMLLVQSKSSKVCAVNHSEHKVSFPDLLDN